MSSEFLDIVPQLTRLVLINSGKADYVEIEPKLSTHLAADNGEGKSSILNALQFLMIDDWNRMKFPRDNADTSVFYFPSQQSHMIFEIRDEVNQYHQIWLTGRTGASKERYQRFILHGRFRKELFINDMNGTWNTKNSQDVLEEASLNGLKFQAFNNSKELRTYLRDILNWYPVAKEFQLRFFSVMRRLNELSDMTPMDLKEVLIEVAQIKSKTLDFENEFKGTWSRLEHEGRILNELQNKETQLRALHDQLEQRKTISNTLIDKLNEIARMMNSKDSGVTRETETLRLEITDKNLKLSILKTTKTQIESKRETSIDRRADLRSTQKILSETEEWAGDFSLSLLSDNVDLAEEIYLAVKGRHERQQRLDGSPKSLERIQMEIENFNKRIVDLKTTLEGLGGSLLESIRSKNLELNVDYWTKYNPGLLLQKGKVVSDIEYSESISRFKTNDIMTLPGIEAEPSATSSLEEFTDPKTLQEKLSELIEKRNNQIQLKTDLEAIEKLEIEFDQARKNHHTTIEHLKRFKDWSSSGKQSLVKANEELEFLKNKIILLEKEGFECISDIKKISDDLEKIEANLDEYNAKVVECERNWEQLCSEHLGSNIPTDTIPFELSIIEENIRDGFSRSEDLERMVSRILESRIELGELAHLLALDQTSQEFVTKALQRFEAISIDEENLTNAWMHLQGSIVKKANMLREGIIEIRRELNSINDRFRKTEVSNLELFRVKLVEDKSEIGVFDALGELGGFAQFTRTDKEMQALEKFKREISKRSKIFLTNMFDLHFTIKNPGEEEREIKRLDFVGSPGQTTVVKSVLLLLLLSKFMKKGERVAKIPVLLDEAGTLGSGNYSEILGVAKALNFQIFTASPKSVSAASVVYPLLKGNREGKLFCDPSAARLKPQSLSILEEE